jgi:transmembrane sensor
MSASDKDWTRINQAVADWRARIRGDDSQATRTAFEVWLAEDPAHREANAAYEAIEAKALLTTLSVPPLHPPQPIWRPTRSTAWMAVAASLALICTLTLTLRHGTLAARQGQDYATATAIRSYALEGGADLILDAHSLVRTSSDDRQGAFILVGGRARFSTPSSMSDTFAVSLDRLRVKARGATFDVQRLGQSIRIIDVAGRVDIAQQGQDAGSGTDIHLAPGDAFVDDAQGERVVTAGREDTHWTTAMLPLDGLTLGEVVAIGNRAGGTPIVLGDPTLAGMPLQGQLAAVDTSALARQLSAAFDLDLAHDARGLVLTRRQ